MARELTLKQIAEEILKIESSIQGKIDSETVKLAEERINELIITNNLRLDEMVQIDEIIQEILHR